MFHEPRRRAARPLCHRLLFALLPPRSAIADLEAMMSPTTAGRRRVPADRLHVTLFVTDDHASLPEDLANRATRAAAAAKYAPVSIVLDQLLSLPGRTLLRASAPAPALQLFQKQLAADLRRAGVASRAGFRFNPHCTLAYGADPMANGPIAPVGWTATEFILIHSLVGLTEHRVLGQWRLGAPRAV